MIRPGSDFWTSRKLKIKAGRPPKHVGGRWPPGGTANKVVTRRGDKISKSNVSQFFPPSCLNQESPFKSTLFPAKDLVPDLCEGVGDEWFRWRRRRRGVWLQLYTVSRPSGSQQLHPGLLHRLQTSSNATLAKARHCGVVQAGVVSGVAVTDVDCEVGGCAPPPVTLLSQMCPTTCEMAYPPPPLLPRPDFPHFPHLAPPPSNFPSLGPTNSFSTPSGYPGLFPRLPGIFLQPIDLLALKIFLESIITSILLLIFALSVLNTRANFFCLFQDFPLVVQDLDRHLQRTKMFKMTPKYAFLSWHSISFI